MGIWKKIVQHNFSRHKIGGGGDFHTSYFVVNVNLQKVTVFPVGETNGIFTWNKKVGHSILPLEICSEIILNSLRVHVIWFSHIWVENSPQVTIISHSLAFLAFAHENVINHSQDCSFCPLQTFTYNGNKCT